jgi:hypothetical protein
LERFLDLLQARGVRVDGELVHPQIDVGTCTGRVTYTDPCPQNWPKADRLARLGPVVAGRVFVRTDYGQIEPRILLAVLKHYGLIDWEPGEDLYKTLGGDQADRDQVKILVNTLINGGRPSEELTGRLAEFVAALDAYRARLAAVAKTTWRVHTMTGRPILLDADEMNHGGKAVNRVVQGSAADVFNRAVLRVDDALAAEGLPAAVAFLLYDELWVECDPAIVPQVVELLRREMEAAAQALGVMVPAKIEQDDAEDAPGPWYVDRHGQASRERPTESRTAPAPPWPPQPAVAKPPIPPKGQRAGPAGVASTHDEPPVRLDPNAPAPAPPGDTGSLLDDEELRSVLLRDAPKPPWYVDRHGVASRERPAEPSSSRISESPGYLKNSINSKSPPSDDTAGCVKSVESPPSAAEPPPQTDPAPALIPVAPWPPRRRELAYWPLSWRERWGRLANRLQDRGTPWPACEWLAFVLIKRKKEAALHG